MRGSLVRRSITLNAPRVILAAVILCLLVMRTPVVNSSGQTLSSVQLGTVPRGVAVDSGAGVLYAVLYLNDTTLALDTTTFRTIATFHTPSPYAVAVDAADGRAYVSQGESPSIQVVDGNKGSIVGSVIGAGTPYTLAVDQTRNEVFAADTAGGALWVIDGANDTVVAHLPIQDSSALAVDTGNHEAYAAIASTNSTATIEAVSTVSNSVVSSVRVPLGPLHFAVDEGNHLLLVTGQPAASSQDNFFILDDETMKVLYSTQLGDSPNEIAAGSSSNVFVSDVGNGRLYEMNDLSHAIEMNSTGDASSGLTFTGVTSMAFDAKTGDLYLTEREVTSLLVLSTGEISQPSSSSSSSTPASASFSGATVVVLVAFGAVLSGVLIAGVRRSSVAPRARVVAGH